MSQSQTRVVLAMDSFIAMS